MERVCFARGRSSLGLEIGSDSFHLTFVLSVAKSQKIWFTMY